MKKILDKESNEKRKNGSALNYNISNECSGDNTNLLKMVYATSQSIDLEIEANSQLDTNLISGTFMLIMIFAIILMSFNTTWITSPGVLLPMAGITSAMFGLTSGFGFLAMIGYKGCSLIYVIPYLVLGIGIDDMFIIYSSFTYAYKHRSNEKDKNKIVSEIMKETLRKSGVSIAITSITDFVAFIVGVTTGFKSVQMFCVYAAFSIGFCFFYQCCLFSGVLCLHSKRIQSKQNAFLICVKQEKLNCLSICITDKDSDSKAEKTQLDSSELVNLNDNTTINKEENIQEQQKISQKAKKSNRVSIFMKKSLKALICTKTGILFFK